MSIRTLQLKEAAAGRELRQVRDRLRAGQLTATGVGQTDVSDVVRRVIGDVRTRGDAAVIELTEKFDKVRIAGLRVDAAAIRRAHDSADAEFMGLVRRAIANIRAYQESIRVQAPPPLVRDGRELGVRYTPVDRAGIYVPGGKAFYPSTVLMCVVPAQVAGVKQIAIACPPTFKGDVNPMVLALACELGVDEVYRMGGSQAVAAMALGTASVPAVDMLVGPGNAFVAEAKKQLFGVVGIDSIAGPSEILIIADDTADASFIAADMLAQAEHDPGSAILVTAAAKLASQVAAAIDKQLAGLSRATAIKAALEQNSCIVVAESIEQACVVANDFATEHLQITTADDRAVLARIRHAGAIFLGSYTPVPLGDYYAGPSHVLPTGGTARFFGPLSCNSFLKASSVIRYGRDALLADAADVIDFATREGLTAHAQAIEERRRS